MAIAAPSGQIRPLSDRLVLRPPRGGGAANASAVTGAPIHCACVALCAHARRLARHKRLIFRAIIPAPAVVTELHAHETLVVLIIAVKVHTFETLIGRIHRLATVHARVRDTSAVLPEVGGEQRGGDFLPKRVSRISGYALALVRGGTSVATSTFDRLAAAVVS